MDPGGIPCTRVPVWWGEGGFQVNKFKQIQVLVTARASWTDRLTYRTENITFYYLSLAGGNKYLQEFSKNLALVKMELIRVS